MMQFAVGYQHFAYGAKFADIALAHPSVREVYFPWIDEPSGRPMLGYEEENDSDNLAIALHRDLVKMRERGIKLDLLLNAIDISLYFHYSAIDRKRNAK